MKKILFGIVGLCIILYSTSLIYIGLHVYDNTAQKSDAIVVLGAKSIYKDKLNPCLTARVDQGIKIYKESLAPIVIMAGGADTFNGKSQAEIMKEIALEKGISADHVLLETRSKNTLENLEFTKIIMENHHLKTVIIVSDPYHLPRALLLAKSLHILATVSPALDSPCWSNNTFLSTDYFRDGFALLFYVFTGRISLM
jgi:uncharacterized SAM-binding protein YcdF (DUF218 family)